MAIGHIVQQQSQQAEELQKRLTAEWKIPSNAEPVLIEERSGRMGNALHLYVIWHEWGTLSQRERSKIIMQAFQDTHDDEAILNVTIAMGLTPEEANRMGIRYNVDDIPVQE